MKYNWDVTVKHMRVMFKITHVLRARNQISHFLVKNATFFHRELLFIVCSIPIWLPRPPQVWVIEKPFVVKKKEKTHAFSIKNFNVENIAQW